MIRFTCATTPISGSRTSSRAFPASARYGCSAAATMRCASGAIQEQNVQVSAGQLGAEPIKGGSDFLIAINAQGRLRTAQEFGDIVLKAGSNGEVVRLSDVAHIELGASDYTLRGQL